jgi:recombination protein RecR
MTLNLIKYFKTQFIIPYFCVMDLPSKHLAEAVEQLATLPSIGKRSALRLVLDLLKRSPEEVERFASAFTAMKKNIQYCQSCGNISDQVICKICANPNRDHTMICVVEDIRDIMAIEATASYKGIYHVLGGIISPMDGLGPDDLNIQSLIDKVAEGKVSEVIFALSSTMEGDTTNFYIYKKLSPYTVTITTLSRGVAVGSELHYADELTLSRSISQRLPFDGTFNS